MVEQGLPARGAAEYDIGGAHLLAQQAGELTIARGEDAKVGFGPALALLGVCGDGIEALEDAPGRVGEAAIDDVDGANGGAPQHQGQADVPVGLLPRAEGGDGLHTVAADHQAS